MPTHQGYWWLNCFLLGIYAAHRIEGFVPWAPAGMPSLSHVRTYSSGALPPRARVLPHRWRVLEARADASGETRAMDNSKAVVILKEAVKTRRVSTEEVSASLRYLAEGSGAPATIEVDEIEGEWELVFSTQLKQGYMPIRELVGFFPSREQASLNANAGPIPLGGMQGQCWWKGGVQNELAFALGKIKLGPFSFGKDDNEIKTYQFFILDDQVLGARSSAGGFALLSRAS